MIRRILLVVAAVGALLTAAAVPGNTANAAVTALPGDVSGVRFWSPQVCVQSEVDNQTWDVPYAAQQFNLKSGGVLKLNARADCAAAGYQPSRYFIVRAHYVANSPYCVTSSSANTSSYYNGMYRWTNAPVFYVEMDGPDGCLNTDQYGATRLLHTASQAVGLALGLKYLNSTGYNSRVMNNTDFSRANVGSCTAPEGTRISELYRGAYGG